MSNADFAKSVTPGLILPLAIVAICYLKCRVATNIINWLKVKSRWFKNYIFAKKCIFTCFWIFKYCFYYSFTLYYCTSFYSSGFFSTNLMSDSLDPGQADIWVQNICKGYQQTTKVAPGSKEFKKYKITC